MKTESNKRKQSRFKGLMLFVVLMSIMSCRGEQSVPNLTGHFSGRSKIIVNWCKQDSLFFDLKIDKQGDVSGVIGDANIIQGKVKKNRWGSRDYLIEADLSGYIVGKETISRESVKIPFDLVGDSIMGGFATSGSKIGGKDRMILSGADLILIKQ